MAKKLIDKSIPRFLMVGVLNTLVGAGVMFLLFNLAGWAYWTASGVSFRPSSSRQVGIPSARSTRFSASCASFGAPFTASW